MNTGTNVLLTVNGYSDHTFQIQSSPDLTPANFAKCRNNTIRHHGIDAELYRLQRVQPSTVLSSVRKSLAAAMLIEPGTGK